MYVSEWIIFSSEPISRRIRVAFYRESIYNYRYHNKLSRCNSLTISDNLIGNRNKRQLKRITTFPIYRFENKRNRKNVSLRTLFIRLTRFVRSRSFPGTFSRYDTFYKYFKTVRPPIFLWQRA